MTDELDNLIAAEEQRQSEGLELIASENYASANVRRALGTVYTNKYAEGYPGRRWYGGQENTDAVETRAIELAKQLFHADHANVQSYSGAPANLAAYLAWCEPGDTIMGMDLTHGGHLTHGASVTLSAKLFDFVHYGMSNVETGAIDYDEVRALALKHKPKIIIAGFSSYPRELDYDRLSAIASEVGAVAMADVAHIAGLIAAGVLANPLDHGFQIMTSTTHKTLRGPRGGLILSKGTVGSSKTSLEKTIDNLPNLIDRSVFPGLQAGPHMNQILAKMVAFEEALDPSFKDYAQAILANAKRLSEELMKRNVKLITGGTDNHLMVIDCMTSWQIGGAEAQDLFDKVGLTINKNVIPDDTRTPSDPSGIRLGTPAITTRGMGEAEMVQIAELITRTVESLGDQTQLDKIQAEVKALAKRFPLPS